MVSRVKVTGILYDQTGKALFNFNTTHNGMGKFLLVPDKQDVFMQSGRMKKELNTERICHRSNLPE